MARAVIRPDGTIAVDAPETPTGVFARRGLRGIVVTHNRSEGAAGYEIHVSTTPGFTPSPSTLQGSGDNTIWTIPSLAPPEDPERMHYVRVIAYDSEGNKSEPSAEVSSPPGRLSALDVPDGLITTPMIQAKAISDFYSVREDDPIETLSDTYVPMPGMNLVVPIEQPCTVWYSSLSPVQGGFRFSINPPILSFQAGFVRLMIDGEEVGEDYSPFTAPGVFMGYRTYGDGLQYPLNVEFRLEWRLGGGDPNEPDQVANAAFRTISTLILKR